VRSVPPGAEVRVDDRAVGTAPVTVSAVRMDERHRVDLTLPGYELDQFVVLPEQDGTAFSRTLARTAPPVVPAAAPAPRSRSKEKGRP
jgi:eukaryotic-like serine/threonine-protein kinase